MRRAASIALVCTLGWISACATQSRSGIDPAAPSVVGTSWETTTATPSTTVTVTPRPTPTPDRTLDPSFGQGGMTWTDVLDSSLDNASSMAVLPDNRFYVSGSVDVSNTALFGIARYTTSGALDATFGGSGIVSLNVGPGLGGAVTTLVRPGSVGTLSALPKNSPTTGIVTSSLLIALDDNGALDPTFGNGGVATLQTRSRQPGLAIDVNGDIAVVGNEGPASGPFDGRVQLLDPSGTPIASFGSSGSVVMDLGGTQDVLEAATFDGSGGVFAAGFDGSNLVVIHLKSDGTADPAWGTGGIARASLGRPAGARNLYVDGLGRVVVGGWWQEPLSAGSENEPMVARFLSNGTPDTSFGGGSGWAHYVDLNQFGLVSMVLPTNAGKYLIAGTYNFYDPNFHTLQLYFGVERALADGSLDPGFPLLLDAVGNDGGAGRAVAVQSNGSILEAGTSYGPPPHPGTRWDIVVVRHVPIN